MKKSLILACLLTTISAMPACAGAFAPSAELTVNQMPRVAVPAVRADDDILTPLPGEDSALPPFEKPQSNPPAKLLGLAPADMITPATGMPPPPHPIANEPQTAELYGPAIPPMPAPEKVSFRPGTAIPFPPSAEEWSARMPLTAKATKAEPTKTASANRPEKTEEQTPAPQRPSRHKITRTASADDEDDDAYRPRHIVVRQEGDVAGNCRGYTRNLGGGRVANGTACADSNGIWRIADEHLVTRMRVARAYHINRAHSYGPSFGQAASVAHLGLTLGNFWHFR